MKCPDCGTPMKDEGPCGDGRLMVCPKCGSSLCTRTEPGELIRRIVKSELLNRKKQK